MSKTRVVTGLLSTVFLLTVFSSARADSLHADMFLEKLIYAENHNLTVLDDQSAATDYLYTGHFENNNGKHLGFTMSSVQRGPRFGIVKPLSPDSATPNPEPTAMVLLGTGLAGAAALARKRSRSRRR
jgi:PEP-CTERM motif-containing protein